MDHFERAEVLKTFRIIVDNREQHTPKAAARYSSFGVPYDRGTLRFGDYCGNITLPAGDILDVAKPIIPRCVIERKMSLDELAMCFTRGRDRFRREMERARDCGAVMYLLIENGSYEAIMSHRYRSQFRPEAFLASLFAWMVRYELRPVFCKAESSGRIIHEILYRDMKERLERGEYG